MPCYKRKLSKGERWYYDVNINGQRHHSKAIFLTKAKAKKAEAELVSGIELKAQEPKPRIRLQTLIDERLADLKARRTMNYWKENKRQVEKLKTLKVEYADQVTKQMVITLLRDEAKAVQKRGVSNYRVNSLLRCLKALFEFGVNYLDIEMRNPAKVPLYSIEKRLKYIPTNEEIEAVLADCNEQQALLVAFCLETGCRVSEALNAEIRGEQVALSSRKARNSNLRTRLVPRPIWFTDLFYGWSEPPRFISDKTGSKWSFHNLRHRYASRLANQGVPLYLIMKRLGHSQISTTQIYLQELGLDLH